MQMQVPTGSYFIECLTKSSKKTTQSDAIAVNLMRNDRKFSLQIAKHEQSNVESKVSIAFTCSVRIAQQLVRSSIHFREKIDIFNIFILIGKKLWH